MKYYIYIFGVNQWFSIYVKDSVSPDNSRSLDNDTLNSVNCLFVPLAQSSFNHHVLILWLGMWLWSTKKKVQVCGLCLNQGHRLLLAWRPSCGVASSAGVVAVCASECLWYHWPLLVLGRDRPMTHTPQDLSKVSVRKSEDDEEMQAVLGRCSLTLYQGHTSSAWKQHVFV